MGERGVRERWESEVREWGVRVGLVRENGVRERAGSGVGERKWGVRVRVG